MALRLICEPEKWSVESRADWLTEDAIAPMDGLMLFAKTSLSPLGGALSVPLVVADPLGSSRGASTVGADWDRGVGEAVAKLAELGHRRIGWIGPTFVHEYEEHSDPRYDAFRRQMQARHFPLNVDWLLEFRHYPRDYDRLDRLAAMPAGSRPTALLLRTAAWSIPARLVRAGLRIGRDISLVSVEYTQPWASWLAEAHLAMRNDAFFARNMDTGEAQADELRGIDLAHVARDWTALGRAAVEELDRRWANPSAGPVDVMLPTEFRPGNSVGPRP